MASITSLRVRPLSEKGRQLLEDKVSWFNQKLLCIKSDIDSLIRSVDGRDMNVEEVRKNLLESLQCYEDISINFVCFLETQRSLESDREKVSHLLVRDTLRSKVQKCLLDLKQLDIKIKQRTSSVSSTTSDLRRKKYELNAARAKVKHVELELQEIMRQKKELDARMSLLAVKQEEIKLETEVQELEDLELSNSSVSDSLPLFKYEQISNFDIRNCEHDRNICVDIGFIPPPVEFQDCESVFEKVAAACDVPVLNNITNINSETMTSVPNLSNPTLHHYVNSVIAPANSFDRLPYISSYQKSKASLYKDIYPIPVPPVATPRKDNFPLTYVSDISGSLDNVPSTCKNNSIPLQNSGKIQFMPTRNIMNETYSVHSSSEPDNQSNDSSSQVEMCKLMTQMMAHKDIVLTRLVKYDDSPMHYVSWKQTFKDVINELGVNDAEELDLLLRWLGPASAKQAASIKASCGGNLLEALKKLVFTYVGGECDVSGSDT
ncbi:hypothetical protein KUTeg_007915 [Tegillarca granosa]|uniref:Uncharacterized protein n=1 Tax=Tegillarca granosa TaxID=220873 RepID=A0ABQ9FJA3_TEGGR|nr:hypothetical protein KUTeg_007915 [Tegillarca granosa]